MNDITWFYYHRVYQKFNIPYAALAMPLALVISIGVFLMEWFIPWTEDLDPSVSLCSYILKVLHFH